MNNTQHEQLFTDLTPTQAAVVEGGAVKTFGEAVDFDFFRSTRSFKVRPGGSITLASSTRSAPSNPSFDVAVRNVKTGKSTPAERVPNRINRVSTGWTNMRGGTYKIDFVDTKDGINVTGGIAVTYDA